MWVAGSLGFKRQVFLFLGKGTQSQGIKTGGFKGYQPNHRDVFVCTYSKSGTNWALQIAYQLSAKYISIIRDPKEAFVSSYHFSAGMLPRGQMIGVEAWLELFLSAEFPYGSWAEHVAGYWAW
jgi:hypothetical protein